ncbi:hypothetical protein GGR92_005244 [Spirosoma lacussanchae]|uniref:GIY-YIG nuclease family protein n=1 Tax=Spirosoma lacussanchae TaxID=1884249 RepID=UPI0014875695|nr:GIY-YIG nuclease family protein [Spirosoma lacussanchae]
MQTPIPDHLNIDKLRSQSFGPESLTCGMSGTYYLFSADGNLLYVGSTQSLRNRMSAHRCKGLIPFALITLLYADRRLREEWEVEAIKTFRPPYNKNHNPDWQYPKESLIGRARPYSKA